MTTIVGNFVMLRDKYPLKKFDDKSKNNRFWRLHKFSGIDDVGALWLMLNFCKRLRFPMQFRTDLERLLIESPNSPRFFNWQSCFGMDPSIKFSSRNNLCNLSNSLRVDCMFQVKLLLDKSRKYKFFKEPIPIGIWPFIWFSLISKFLSESENFPMASGIVIFKGLMDNCNSSKNLQLV